VAALSRETTALVAKAICAVALLGGVVLWSMSAPARRAEWRMRLRNQPIALVALRVIVFLGLYLFFGPPYSRSGFTLASAVVENLVLIGFATAGILWWFSWVKKHYPLEFRGMMHTGRLPPSVSKVAYWQGIWRFGGTMLVGAFVVFLVPGLPR